LDLGFQELSYVTKGYIKKEEDKVCIEAQNVDVEGEQ